MKNKLNPYHELTELYDPFGIFGIQSILFESFKKIMFAGCDGRKKSRKRDLKEAKYSIERAIRMIEEQGVNGKIEWIDADFIKVLSVKYITVTHNGIQFMWGMELLEFCRTGKIKKLKKVASGIGRMLNDFEPERVENDS